MKHHVLTASLFYTVAAAPHDGNPSTGTLRKKKSILHEHLSKYPAREVHLPKKAGRHHDIEEKERIGVRIVGGTKVDAVGRYPFFVSWGGECGGSLIHSDIVLTAAHCAGTDNVVNEELVINAYELDNSNSPPTVVQTTEGTIVRRIAQQSTHPNYDDWTAEYDFLLFKLDSPITTIDPIPLSSQSSSPTEGNQLKVIGLGQTSATSSSQPDFLLQVDVTAISDASCNNMYADDGGIDGASMFCAGTPDGGKDSCHGDSGGPIFTYDLNSGDAITQVGVVSWGIGCADARYPGVYAEIGAVRDWIDSEICRLSSDKPDSCGGGGDDDDDGPPEPPSGDKAVVDIDVRTDDYPQETSWILFDSGGNAVKQVEEFTYTKANTLYSISVEVDKGKEYEFEIYDSYGDGNCCEYGRGGYEVRVDGKMVGSGGEFGEMELLTFVASGDNGPPPEPPSLAVVGIDIITDDYPEETSWILFDSDGNAVKQVEEFTYNKPETRYSISVEVNRGEKYEFEIYDFYGDGNCCEYGRGGYEVRVDGKMVGSGGEFGEMELLTFVVPGDGNTRTNSDPSSQCEDSLDLISIDASVGEKTCAWLAGNIGYYNYLCQFLDVAIACPVTCDACEKVQL